MRVLCFAGHRLDTGAGRLWRADEPLHLTPKAFDLLRFLAERPGELVSKEALFRAVWPGTTVSDDALTRCLGEVRRALADDARQPTFVETVHRRGFRFLPRVSAETGRPPRRPFVGRESALTQGRVAFEQALAGRAQRLFVCGEPGVGKTRLAEELAEVARAAGALPLWGRASEGEGRPPYWIWQPVLEGCGVSGIAYETPGFGAEVVGSTIGPAILPEPTQARFPVFDAVRRALARAAERQPLFVVLDDLHAADADSLRLLGFLAQELASCRILLVGTYRDVGAVARPAFGETLERLVPAGDGRTLIALRGLAREEVHRLLAALTDDEVAERFAATVHDKTGGNPLYLHEIARLLVDAGSAVSPADWSVAPPETVRQVLRRRLDGLSEDCRDALALAAVAGTEFSPRLLERTSERGDAAFADGLHEARTQRLVYAEGPEFFRFAHGLLREILYEDLRPGVRARLHRRIALELESTSAAREEPPLAGLAHHFGRAVLGGDLDKAIRYARLAAEHAMEAYAFEEAAVHFDTALGLLESMLPLDAGVLCHVEVSAARAHFLCGRLDRARTLAAAALDHARATGSADDVHRASAIFCELQPSFQRDPAELRVLDDALARLAPDAFAARARLLGLRGMRSFVTADPADHVDCGRAALELARRSGDRRVLLESLRCLGFALLHPSDETEWRDRYEEMIRVASDEESAGFEFDARLFRLEHRMRTGPPEAIDHELVGLDALAQRLGTPGARAAMLRARAGHALARGAFEDAERGAVEALEVGRHVDAPLARAISVLQLVTLRHIQGRIGETLPDVRSGAALHPEVALFQAGVILTLAESGQRDEARRRLKTLVYDGFAGLPRDVTYPMALANLAFSCERLDSREGAESLLGLLHPYAGRSLTLMYYYQQGCASRELGLLAGVLGRWDEAACHFETALEVDRRMGARTWEAHVLVDYARMLRARGDAASCARAVQLLAEARQITQALGMPAIEHEIATLTAKH